MNQRGSSTGRGRRVLMRFIAIGAIALLALLFLFHSNIDVDSSCPYACSGHGTCNTTDLQNPRCECHPDYTIAKDCSIERVTDDELLSHCPRGCGAPTRGSCNNDTGRCVCSTGYHGFDCSFEIPEGYTIPSFMVIGAQKGGTTVANFWLDSHSGAKSQKLHFFDDNYSDGYNEFIRNFALLRTTQGAIKRDIEFGCGSPKDLLYYNVPPRVFQMFPDMKMVVLLREPVARAYSAFEMNVRKGEQHGGTFASTMRRMTPVVDMCLPDWDKCAADFADEENWYHPRQKKRLLDSHAHVARGLYAFQLERWMKFFPRDQFFITCSERLHTQKEQVAEEMFEFVGLSREPLRDPKLRNTNTGVYVPMDPKLKRELEAYFEPYNERLTHLLGEEICPEWKEHHRSRAFHSERREHNHRRGDGAATAQDRRVSTL